MKFINNQIEIYDSPCFIQPNNIDLIIDINAMSCINPSDRYLYRECLNYWLKDDGLMLLNTYQYDLKLSNYPPYTIHPNQIYQWFGENNYKLLGSRKCTKNGFEIDAICHSWLIHKK